MRLLLGQGGEDRHSGEPQPVSGGEGELQPLQAASCVGSLEVCQLLVEASAEVCVGVFAVFTRCLHFVMVSQMDTYYSLYIYSNTTLFELC